ncbi:hypothetical protein ACT3RO_12000 [Psychrobacter sp. AOP5-CZ1-12]|uniref:hypothetical protein n=1 Tax=Psychrobacter sp. AOP5-CZ1-12 TaxID=3457651 RepID=UPI00402B1537
MIKKVTGLFSKKTDDKKGIDKTTLDTVINIAKRDKGNVLILFTDDSYKDYTYSRDEVKFQLSENIQGMPSKQRINGMDMSYSSDSELTIRNTVRNIKNDFKAAAEETKYFDRLFKSVFTRSRAELNEVAIQCLALEDVNVYIV